MIIGIDGNEANVEKRVGISEYAFELLKQFSNSKKEDTQFVVYLKEKPRADMPKENSFWKYRIVGPKKLWTQIGLPFDLFTHSPRPDVFFTPTHYSPRFSPVKTAVSIMDLSYIHFPELFRKSDLYQLQNWSKYSILKATRVFTISNFSKDDIIKVYKLPSEKVVVTHLGLKMKTDISASKVDEKEVLQKLDLNSPFILFVGTLQPRKNLQRLIQAFGKIKKSNEYPKLQLAIVGKKGWLFEDILKEPQKLGIASSVRFLEFVSDKELGVLYKNAEFFVLPSLYEGFGLPVLEAMSFGCPVITSNISSLPEAAGDAALYVDPESIDDIAAKMETLLKDDNLKNELKEKGYKQVKKFSWEKTAQETLSVLQTIAQK